MIRMISLNDNFKGMLESKLYGDGDVHISVDLNIRTPGIKHGAKLVCIIVRTNLFIWTHKRLKDWFTSLTEKNCDT